MRDNSSTELKARCSQTYPNSLALRLCSSAKRFSDDEARCERCAQSAADFEEWKAKANDDWQPDYDEPTEPPEAQTASRALLDEQGQSLLLLWPELFR
jgi:hypothetical protein